MGFVRVSSSSGLLEQGQDPFVICGANCYYLMTKHHEQCPESKPFKVLESLKQMGINCVRTWAFSDGNTPSFLQPHPCFFDESVFQSLDAIIAHCKDLGMKILLELTNFWPDYGGMGQYVVWSRERREKTQSLDTARVIEDRDMLASHFYTDPFCQKLFRRFIEVLIRRRNSVTGILYCEDDTILGYGLANEPRCYLDPGCSNHTIAMWAHATAELIKSLDSNHLVFMDCEGFFGPSTKDIYSNPFDTTSYGTDFAQDTNSPYIDVCCIHMYPEKWLPNNTEAENLEFMEQWIHTHLEVAAMLDKPLLISEYGFIQGPTRIQYFVDFSAITLRHVRNQSKLVGSMFWQACSEAYRYGDEYAIIVDNDGDDSSKAVVEELCISLTQGYRNLNRFQSRRIQMDDERYDTRKFQNREGRMMKFIHSSPQSFRRKIDSTSCRLM